MHGILYTDKHEQAASQLYMWQDESGQKEIELGCYMRHILPFDSGHYQFCFYETDPHI